MRFQNFVVGHVAESVSTLQQSIIFSTSAPYQDPPDPDGDVARLVISDSRDNPTRFEIIGYTGIGVKGGQPALVGVTRGLEGTAIQSWPSGSILRQDITAEQMAILELQEQVPFVYAAGRDTAVRKFSPAGNQVWVNSAHDDDVLAMDVHPDGTVRSYSLDGTIRKIDRNGQTQWTHEAAGPSTTNLPSNVLAVGYSGKTYYATAASGNTLACIDQNGNQEWSVTLPGAPSAIAVDQSDNVFVVSNSGLQRYLPDGTLAWSKTDFEGAALDVSAPGNGLVFVSDVDHVYALNGSGRVVSSFTEGSVPLRISANHQGQVLVFRGPSEVALYDASGTEVWSDSVGLNNNRLSLSSLGIAAVGVGNDVRVYDTATGDVLQTIAGAIGRVLSCKINPLSPAFFATKVNGGFAWSRVDKATVAGDEAVDSVLISEGQLPATPPAFAAWLYVEDGNLRVKFDDGTVRTIASN